LSNIDLTVRGRIRFAFSLSLSLSAPRSGNTLKSRLAERNEISSRIGAHVECKKIAGVGRSIPPHPATGPGFTRGRTAILLSAFANKSLKYVAATSRTTAR
jgi:hypothetical protein